MMNLGLMKFIMTLTELAISLMSNRKVQRKKKVIFLFLSEPVEVVSFLLRREDPWDQDF
jgi:hypothetical protein